jgi:hypothetical protein
MIVHIFPKLHGEYIRKTYEQNFCLRSVKRVHLLRACIDLPAVAGGSKHTAGSQTVGLQTSIAYTHLQCKGTACHTRISRAQTFQHMCGRSSHCAIALHKLPFLVVGYKGGIILLADYRQHSSEPACRMPTALPPLEDMRNALIQENCAMFPAVTNAKW